MLGILRMLILIVGLMNKIVLWKLEKGRNVPVLIDFHLILMIGIRGKYWMDRFLCMILRYRLALQGKAVGCNEASVLECPGIREPLG